MVPNSLEKSKVIWEGNIYQSGSEINLEKPLKTGRMYIMQFLGISSVYYVYFSFIYDKNYIQYSYSDGTDSFRYRFDVSENRQILTINEASFGNAENTKLTKIFEIN